MQPAAAPIPVPVEAPVVTPAAGLPVPAPLPEKQAPTPVAGAPAPKLPAPVPGKGTVAPRSPSEAPAPAPIAYAAPFTVGLQLGGLNGSLTQQDAADIQQAFSQLISGISESLTSDWPCLAQLESGLKRPICAGPSQVQVQGVQAAGAARRLLQSTTNVNVSLTPLQGQTASVVQQLRTAQTSGSLLTALQNASVWGLPGNLAVIKFKIRVTSIYVSAGLGVTSASITSIAGISLAAAPAPSPLPIPNGNTFPTAAVIGGATLSPDGLTCILTPKILILSAASWS